MQAGEVSLSRIMQNISLRYTKWINYTRSRTGHVFQGRYKAILIDADNYLLELVRYVHLNPVRAGIVAVAEDYSWSGHGGYTGSEAIPWLTTEWLLSMLSPQLDEARVAYKRFVADGIVDSSRRGEFHSGTYDGTILGDDRFADNVLARANLRCRPKFSLEEVTLAVCRRYGISQCQLKAPGKTRPYNEARAVAAFLVRESMHLSLSDLSSMLSRDVSAMGKAAERVASQVREGGMLAGFIEEIRTDLYSSIDR
jgi:hypothetical protein